MTVSMVHLSVEYVAHLLVVVNDMKLFYRFTLRLSPRFSPDPVQSLPISVPGTDLGTHFGPTV
jgi:hypothetical protein